MKKLIYLIPVALLVGCTTALEKQCKSTNWFDHGYKVAMSGKRLSTDSFLNECKREDYPSNEGEADLGFKAGMANYCKPEVVYNTGKAGDFLSIDFCDPSDYSILKRKHAEGVEAHCQKENGYSVGASGRVYNQICPKKLEPSFMPEYRRGRKVYLTQTIYNKEQEILNSDRKVSDLQLDIGSKQRSMMMIPPPRQVYYYPGMTAQQRIDAENQVRNENDENNRRRQDLNWDISRLENEIKQARSSQDEARKQILELRRERDTLE